MESWQRQPAAGGRVEKMISNPEKCRPDGGPKPALGGGREGRRRPHRQKRRGAGERAQELVWENPGTVTTIPSLLHPQILIEGLLSPGQSARF